MDLLIGHALMRWNFITQPELDAGLSLAAQTRLPLGKSLIALNVMSEINLRTSVLVQSMLRDGILSEHEADCVMKLCRTKNISLNQAFIMTGLISLSAPRTRLGQLLVDCQCLEQNELPRLLQISQKTGLPLGMVLVNCNAVDTRVLDTVIRFQKLQRLTNSMVDLKTLKSEVGKVQGNSMVQSPTDTRLGSLMVTGAIISKSELTAALEIAAVNEKMLGELLLEFAWITPTTLEAALELQKSLRDGETDLENAAQILRSVHLTKSNLQEVISQRTPTYTRNLIFGKFLVIAGFITEPEMKAACSSFVNIAAVNSESSSTNETIICEDPDLVKDAVCKAGLATQTTVKAAMRYWQSARDGMVPLVKAIVLFADQVLKEEQLLISKLLATGHCDQL